MHPGKADLGLEWPVRWHGVSLMSQRQHIPQAAANPFSPWRSLLLNLLVTLHGGSFFFNLSGLQRLRFIGTDSPWLFKILEATISAVLVRWEFSWLASSDHSGSLCSGIAKPPLMSNTDDKNKHKQNPLDCPPTPPLPTSCTPLLKFKSSFWQ